MPGVPDQQVRKPEPDHCSAYWDYAHGEGPDNDCA
jgi:hypothetical protein